MRFDCRPCLWEGNKKGVAAIVVDECDVFFELFLSLANSCGKKNEFSNVSSVLDDESHE